MNDHARFHWTLTVRLDPTAAVRTASGLHPRRLDRQGTTGRHVLFELHGPAEDLTELARDAAASAATLLASCTSDEIPDPWDGGRSVLELDDDVTRVRHALDLDGFPFPHTIGDALAGLEL